MFDRAEPDVELELGLDLKIVLAAAPPRSLGNIIKSVMCIVNVGFKVLREGQLYCQLKVEIHPFYPKS